VFFNFENFSFVFLIECRVRYEFRRVDIIPRRGDYTDVTRTRRIRAWSVTYWKLTASIVARDMVRDFSSGIRKLCNENPDQPIRGG